VVRVRLVLQVFLHRLLASVCRGEISNRRVGVR
jgi:hypothetical protein